MKIVLYSSDIALIVRWEKLLKDYELSILTEEKELFLLKDSLLIISSELNSKNSNYIMESMIKNKNKILILDRTPEYKQAQSWLSKGVNGYGNSLMSSSFLISAIEAISNDYIWLPPHITTEFLKNMTINKNEKNLEEELFSGLTNAEKKVATLLRNGYTNMNISEELNISINTVKTHIKHIYEKLKVKDRLSFASLFTN